MSFRRQLLAKSSGRREGTQALNELNEEFEQQVVNKRLRIGESVVDVTQPSLLKVAKTVIAAIKDVSKRDAAANELIRFEVGPFQTCKAVIASCERETVISNNQLADLEKDRETTLVDIQRLKVHLVEAKTFPRAEVEKLAKECNTLPSKAQTEESIKIVKLELSRLGSESERLQALIEKRKSGVLKLAKALEELREDSHAKAVV